MPFDVDGERYVRKETVGATPENAPVQDRDLESLSTLLEVAALCLMEGPTSTFTKAQLIDQLRVLAGESVEIDDRDVVNILDKTSFIQTARGAQLRLR